jgi:hypothetical protein
MIMNMKLIATLAAVVAAGSLSAFGQGYVLFATTKNNVYDNFTTPGTSVIAPGDVTATFIWAATGTTDPLGAGLGTTASTAGNGWTAIASALTNGWSVAQNFTTSTEADKADNNGGVQAGAISYNSSTSFALSGNYTAGGSLEVVVIAWDNVGGAGTLGAAEAAGDAVGWSSAFTYATGATPGSTISNFSVSGETPFGVAPVPEPASLALAGLGGLSMLFLRRRK